jgi:decaprenyl-phosphate phosphoribosyltransferase
MNNVKVSDQSPDMNSSVGRATLLGHLKIMRIDHWVKNVFVLPGIVIALSSEPWTLGWLAIKTLVGLLSLGLVASSNYTINEVLDSPYDRFHPVKCRRPVPVGEVNIPMAYVQWIVLILLGLAVAAFVSIPLVLTELALWLMGCLYNIPPIRTKDRSYLDVLSEAVNNPLRLLVGWYIVGSSMIPSASLLCSYWMVGCYFMAIKRYAEFRDIDDHEAAARYRRSFKYYTLDRLLISIMFYGSAAMLFFGAFTMRYRLELILSYPLVALVMAIYFSLGLKPHSAAQAPEKLHREPLLMFSVILCAILMTTLLFVDIPTLHSIFAPTMNIP